MNRIYSNIKQIALSLLVVGLAIGFSAYKNAQTIAAGDIFITTDGVNYTYLASGYEDELCVTDTQLPPCSFVVTPAGATNVSRTSGFTTSDIPTYDITNNWINPLTGNGFYDLP